MFALLIAVITSAGIIGGVASGGSGNNESSKVTSSPVVYNTQYSSSQSEYYRTDEYNAQHGLEQIKAAQAYASLAAGGKEVAGDGVKIGIIDSGVQASHVEISGNLDSSNSASYITGEGAGDIDDGNGHGTHVASTAAGVRDGRGMHGVAFESDIVVARALNDSGSGSYANIASAIDGVVADNVGVINMSLGGYSDDEGLLESMQAAAAADVVIVSAAGNEGNTTQPAYPAYYATDSEVAGFAITVGAVDEDSDIASFSNKCGDSAQYCLVAPGVDIYAAMPIGSVIDGESCNGTGYCSIQGTSMAAPHVAGAAAVIRGAWPSLTADTVVSILLDTATYIDGGTSVTEDYNDLYGHGLLNLYAAVQSQGTPSITSGTSLSASDYSLDNTSIAVDPIFGDAFSTNVAAQLNSAVFLDKYGRDFKANLGEKISTGSSYTIPTLDNLAFNNYSNQVIPLSFGENFSSQLKFQVSSYKSAEKNSNRLSPNYSQNRYGLKFLINDNSIEDQYLTTSQGFSFTQDLSKDTKAGFAFNTDEMARIKGSKFNNFGFFSAGSFSSTPYQSFVNSSSILDFGTQRNYNQLFTSKDFFDKKFSANLMHQTSYEANTLASQVSNRQNSISDLSFTYLPHGESNFTVSFGNMNEFDNNFLNSKSLGAFETMGDVKTSYFKVSSTRKLIDNFYLITSFSEGQTKANGNNVGILRDYSDIRSRSSSVGLVNDDIFKGKLGILYSEPLRVYKGSASLDVPVGLDSSGNVVRYSSDVSLRPQGKEQNIELFYARYLSNSSQVNFNFITQREAGNVKNAPNNYVGFVNYVKQF